MQNRQEINFSCPFFIFPEKRRQTEFSECDLTPFSLPVSAPGRIMKNNPVTPLFVSSY